MGEEINLRILEKIGGNHLFTADLLRALNVLWCGMTDRKV
jgi:hypothetical protein